MSQSEQYEGNEAICRAIPEDGMKGMENARKMEKGVFEKSWSKEKHKSW